MKTTPKALRLQIGIFGRTNVGKSSLLNMISGQDAAIVSSKPGTTTDVVEKAMELHSVGPVMFLDTAGINDQTDLGHLRMQKTQKAVQRSDVIILVAEPDRWTEYEQMVCSQAKDSGTPLIIVINKVDLKKPSSAFVHILEEQTKNVILCSSVFAKKREMYVAALEKALFGFVSEGCFREPELMSDLVPYGGLVVMVVPIDSEAPKGRIKMLQVQVIREALDHNQIVMVMKETEFKQGFHSLKRSPDLIVCDSPIVDEVLNAVPGDVACTTFSVLLSRFKGDLDLQVKGVCAIGELQDGDRVLIAEACTHHPIEEDIARVKIPTGLKEYTGKDLDITFCAGRDFPQDLSQYKLIVHCGGCMLTRKEMLHRLYESQNQGVAITNYGLCFSFLKGVLKRVISPFSNMKEESKEGCHACHRT